MRQRLGRTLLVIGMGVLTIAGALKLLDLGEFRDSVARWQLIPHAAHLPITLIIPVLELYCGAAWLLGVGGRRLALVGVSLYSSFVGLVVAHAFVGTPPHCGCFGLLDQYFDHLDAGITTAARASILLVACLAGLALTSAKKTDVKAAQLHREQPLVRGFSIIELLLVVAIIAVLLALAAPSLARAKGAARASQTLAYLHGHGAILAQYASDFNDCFPAFFDPQGTTFYIRLADGRIVADTDYYFDANTFWHYALLDRYYNGGPMTPFYAAEQTAKYGAPSGPPFFMSCTIFARPEYWNYGTRSGPNQWGVTRHSDIQFPSKKAVLISGFHIDEGPATTSTPVPVLASDASATRPPLRDYIPGLVDGDGPFQGAVHFADFYAGLHTVDGLRGRDLR